MGIKNSLKVIYGDEYNDTYYEKFMQVVDSNPIKDIKCKQDNSSIYLITYGDIIKEEGNTPLNSLHKFINKHYKELVTDIHILPMFEYTSDDGFSVVDYYNVDPLLGNWSDIAKLRNDYQLMFDFVVNHCSKSNSWVKSNPEYFVEEDKDFDYSQVVRPRVSPLFHQVENRSLWTTFSEDQIDINFKNIDVLCEMTKILLMYINNGATAIRLDAIGFLWKESGSSCIHLPQTHEVIKLWRQICGDVQLITETNVPHLENISYFGNGVDEAQQVYQFALPPLTLYSLITGDATKFSNWAKTISKVSDSATYFNFLASHDGIGMRPTEGILDDSERDIIFRHVENNGGKFNYKTNVDGSKSVYEMNIVYYDAIKNNTIYDTKRFIAAHAILLAMPGVAAIYYNSLFGSTNYYEGVEESGINRRINRQKYNFDEIEKLVTTEEKRITIKEELLKLINVRKEYDAFDPYGEVEILDISRSVVGIKRLGKEDITCLINVSDSATEIEYSGVNLITNNTFDKVIEAYEVIFFKN